MEFISDIPVFGQGNAVPVVDLPVSPGILKDGNSDGTNYGSERVLVKLQVLCNLKDALKCFEGLAGDQEGECKDEGQVPIKHGVEDDDDDPVDLLQVDD
jgi:hypothetical protein